MKTTGLFTTHKVVINQPCDRPIKIIPFGDVHRDSDMHCGTKWREFLAYAKGQKDAYFLGMGDYFDGMSTSEREGLSRSSLHNTTIKNIEKLYSEWIERMSGELAFMKGRLIGMLGGNHFFSFNSGMSSDTILCQNLETRFLGVCSFIRLSIQTHKSKDRSRGGCFDIFAHHGAGGGSTPGATFNTIEKMQQTADADLYLMGHDHKKGCIPSFPRLRLVEGGGSLTIRERTPWLGRTGSFLKAYEDGEVSYNVDAARSACALGWIEFDLCLKRVHNSHGDHLEVYVRGTC
jgi:hypothetical protein